MQRVGYGLADFFVSWLRIGKNLERANTGDTLTNLAFELFDKLDSRKKQLFDTPSMLAAIYLDPRVKHKLNKEQIECASLYLKKILDRQQQLSQTPQEISPNNTLDELNEEIQSPEPDSGAQLIAALADYDKVPHANFKNKVIDFWKDNKEKFPLVYSLACIVHAIPASQCLEELNFSSFSFIKSARRSSLKPENLQNMLTIRLNKELFYEQKQKDIEAIMNDTSSP